MPEAAIATPLTGVRVQECSNAILRSGWTLGSTYLLRVLQATIRAYRTKIVALLGDYWRQHPADMAISLVPHFNRELCEGFRTACPGRPLHPEMWGKSAKSVRIVTVSRSFRQFLFAEGMNV
jgi:hypothetical protein